VCRRHRSPCSCPWHKSMEASSGSCSAPRTRADRRPLSGLMLQPCWMPACSIGNRRSTSSRRPGAFRASLRRRHRLSLSSPMRRRLPGRASRSRLSGPFSPERPRQEESQPVRRWRVASIGRHIPFKAPPSAAPAAPASASGSAAGQGSPASQAAAAPAGRSGATSPCGPAACANWPPTVQPWSSCTHDVAHWMGKRCLHDDRPYYADLATPRASGTRRLSCPSRWAPRTGGRPGMHPGRPSSSAHGHRQATSRGCSGRGRSSTPSRLWRSYWCVSVRQRPCPALPHSMQSCGHWVRTRRGDSCPTSVRWQCSRGDGHLLRAAWHAGTVVPLD
jgi:hypothetical protein